MTGDINNLKAGCCLPAFSAPCGLAARVWVQSWQVWSAYLLTGSNRTWYNSPRLQLFTASQNTVFNIFYIHFSSRVKSTCMKHPYRTCSLVNSPINELPFSVQFLTCNPSIASNVLLSADWWTKTSIEEVFFGVLDAVALSCVDSFRNANWQLFSESDSCHWWQGGGLKASGLETLRGTFQGSSGSQRLPVLDQYQRQKATLLNHGNNPPF